MTAAPRAIVARRFVRRNEGLIMTFVEACIALGALCAFGALILKVVEVSALQVKVRGSGCHPAPKRLSPGHCHDRGSF
jgi:hypothetical protein